MTTASSLTQNTVDAAVMDQIIKDSDKINIATTSSRVFKEEAMTSFDSPFCPTGLYINLTSFKAFGQDAVQQDHVYSTNGLYLHLVSTKVKNPLVNLDEMTVLSVGGPNAEPWLLTETHSLVSFPSNVAVRLPCDALPEKVKQSIASILSHAGATVQDEVKAWVEEIHTSRHAATLIQCNTTGITVSPLSSEWCCGLSTCDKKENLWLNLSDGYIACGRKNWDGSGGCGEALRHYEATGSLYPLAVKLGTITADSEADVFSYAPEENDMVKDPQLSDHLMHWGIRVSAMQKTEKTMTEILLALNRDYEFDKITETGGACVPLTGLGYLGLTNLGNSCYLNSVVQALLALPELRTAYLTSAASLLIPSLSSEEDVLVQWAKLVVALKTDRYCSMGGNTPTQEGKEDLAPFELRPTMFRALVGKDHSEFKTGHQQDALEYWQHLLHVLSRAETLEAQGTNSRFISPFTTSELFAFQFETKLQCLESKKVKYTRGRDALLQLRLPSALDSDETASEHKRQKMEVSEEEQAPPILALSDVLAYNLGAPEMIADFYSTALQRKSTALSTVLFHSFPKYLVIQLQRYYVGPDWTPQKKHVLVPMPETLDLEAYRSQGPQVGEELLPEFVEVSAAATVAMVPDETLVTTLMSMGFSHAGCCRAALATSNPTNPDVAMEWIFAHMEDANFNTPMTPESVVASPSPVKAMDVAALEAMGFSSERATLALGETNHVLERAIEWLFNHVDTDAGMGGGGAVSASTSADPDTSMEVEDAATGPGTYRLLTFISHMGKSTTGGHYVAHVNTPTGWAIYNDEKVAVSTAPPLDVGYIYVYQRTDLVATKEA